MQRFMNKKYFFVFLILISCLLLDIGSLYKKGATIFSVKAQSKGFQIKQKAPVVNEGGQTTLQVVDASGNALSGGIVWSSGSSDIAQVDPNSGRVSGIKTGFATITANRSGESSSVFLVVAKVKTTSGSSVPGDTKTDAQGGVYISNPLQNIIFKADGTLNSKLKIFAGKAKTAGNQNGTIEEALFAGPTAIGVDNSNKGGVYITDTLNHSVRKIGFNRRVETIVGKGSPGASSFGAGFVNFDQLLLNSPRGIVTDNGGNLFIADTDNHAVYYADFSLKQVFLLAGDPGRSGKDDGIGNFARFSRPSGMALSNDGRLLTVADEDNNRVRLIELSRDSSGRLTGNVSTLSKNSSNQRTEITFNKPQSIGIDGTGNIYVVDSNSVQLIPKIGGEFADSVAIAQDKTFNRPVSLTVKGSEVFVLDNGALKIDASDVSTLVNSGSKFTPVEEGKLNPPDESPDALKIISVGAPQITSFEPDTLKLEEQREITIRGKNFAPESQVIVAGVLAQSVTVVSAEELRVRIAGPKVPGKLTISVLTRGGLGQNILDAISKDAGSLNNGEITTLTGGSIFNGDGADAKQTSLVLPSKIATDSKNNIFVGELLKVRQVDRETGIITTIAGGGKNTQDGVLATTSQLSLLGITINKNGNLVIADGVGNRIREINSLTNIITTIAGGNGFQSTGDGGPAKNAGFRNIRDIKYDLNGDLLVLQDTSLRKINSRTGIITTIAGNGQEKTAGDGGLATSASFNGGNSLATDGENNIYICEIFGEKVRKIDARTGIITTVAGTGNREDTVNRNGRQATSVGFLSPSAISISPDGQLFVLDFGGNAGNNGLLLKNEISQIDLRTGILTVKSINFTNFGGDLPAGIQAVNITLDGIGNFLITVFPNFVYSFNLNSQVATVVAGNKNFNLLGDNILAEKAAVGKLEDIAVDSKGNLYLGDYANGQVRKIDALTRQITTVVGKDTSKTVGNGDGSLAVNAVCFPYSLAVDSQDNLLIADNRDNFLMGSRVRKVDFGTGVITTVAGNGESFDSGDNGLATNAGFSFIFKLIVDSKNNIYTFGSGTGGTLRRIDASTGRINLLRNNFLGFNLAVDKQGNLVFGDKGLIKQLNPITGMETVIGGNGQTIVSGDGGLVANAGLGSVISLSFDDAGNLFLLVFDFRSLSTTIRRVDAQTKIITTVAGSVAINYSGDGGLATNAGLEATRSIVVSKQGNIFILINDIVQFNGVRFVKLGLN
jgi:sugar lactone lactonase YvrE